MGAQERLRETFFFFHLLFEEAIKNDVQIMFYLTLYVVKVKVKKILEHAGQKCQLNTFSLAFDHSIKLLTDAVIALPVRTWLLTPSETSPSANWLLMACMCAASYRTHIRAGHLRQTI